LKDSRANAIIIGSGKSTLLSAIPRLIDITSGAIAIDGINVSTVELQKLRSVVCTLSQEPLIFEGTLRENLDPNGAHTDEELLDALELCQLKSVFDAAYNKDPLSQRVISGGADLSVGQRQLLCAARVLLASPPILLVDEGTFG
jgi:ATP-binding cassette subfamily C (CFTR/MRP) protein 10